MFDPLTQPLRGTHSIEASAGTGKTYSITVLWLRLLVEEQLSVEQILVSTFTRAATAELKERLLHALQRAIAVVEEFVLPSSDFSASADDSPERVIIHSAISRDPALRTSLRKRLGEALSSFDLAPISTIHGFCQTLIARHALELGCDPGLTLVEDSSDLLEEIVSDSVLAFADCPITNPEKLPSTLRKIARPLSTRTHANFLAEADSPSTLLHQKIQTELPLRKSVAGIRTFDDILTIVRNALDAQGPHGMLAQSVRKRLCAAIIDECQDSDTTQIRVFQTLFCHADTRSFVVIGDPKQSIYRFRGADLASYKELADSAQRAPQMTVNHRSDGPLISAINHLYGNEYTFPDESSSATPTRYIPVTAKCSEARISDPDMAGALILHQANNTARDPAKREIASWIATECARLLRRQTKIDDRHSGTSRPLLPGDIAVLAANKADLRLVRSELIALGIPCQMDGKGLGSVFKSDEALDILIWLELNEVLSESGDTLSKLCAFLATPLGASSAAEIVEIRRDPQRIATLCENLRKTSLLLTRSGPLPALIHHLSTVQNTHPDLGHDRRLTNWRHLGSLLQTRFARGIRAPAALADWLNRKRCADNPAQEDEESESSLMKLETDEPAIQLLTIHASKGLEYPVVFCPFLWHVSSPRSAKQNMKVATIRQPAGWLLDARENDPDANRDKAIHQEHEEEYRKLYVALTRARHRLYVGLANIADSKGGHQNGSARSALMNLPNLVEILASAVTPEPTADPASVVLVHSPIPHGPLSQTLNADTETTDTDDLISSPSAPPERGLLFTKRSFSSLSRSSTNTEDASHVPDRDLDATPTDTSAHTGDGLLKDLGKAGSELGDRLHRALEDYLGNGRSIAEIAQGLTPKDLWEQALKTITESEIILGEERVRLSEIRTTAITEMQFHMPTNHFSPLTLSQALLEDPLISERSILRREWAESIAGWRFERFSGFLQGFIDLLFERNGRWYVADYKSNRLDAYDVDSMEGAMLHHHYLLQSRIYCVALHRHLAHHLSDYRPETHFGGVLYLFVRDMPKGGTWFECPQPASLESLSNLFTHPR
jgi:exodeoxyribonuclease V beta subunit